MKLVLFAVLLAACLPAAAADALPDLGDASQSVLSLQQERQLGEAIMRQIRMNKQYVNDPELADYINGVGYRLAAASPNAEQSFEFFLIDDPTINAFALPGGFIGVHTGLIVSSQSESELAAVLGHEIAHVTQRHIARLFQQQSRPGWLAGGCGACTAGGALNPDLASAALAGAQYATIQTSSTSRDNERSRSHRCPDPGELRIDPMPCRCSSTACSAPTGYTTPTHRPTFAPTR
jgi:predicted Zn-dependent protease